MAVILSLFLASYSIGTALGATVSGALWTNILPGEIAKRLSDPELVALAYGSPFKFILTYTWETPERQAVVEAYRYIQKILCTVGACLCVLLIGFACFLRDHKLQSVVAIDEVEEKGQKLEDDQDFIVDFFKKLFHKN
jgi:SIT family siderophore-iron:H+ symporter-like MFS transporter